MHVGHFNFIFTVKNGLLLTVNISMSNNTTLAPEDLPPISSTDAVSGLVFQIICILYTLIILII